MGFVLVVVLIGKSMFKLVLFEGGLCKEKNGRSVEVCGEIIRVGIRLVGVEGLLFEGRKG